MKWKTICIDRGKGCLGVRCLSSMNRALLCKWSWRFAVDSDSLGKLLSAFSIGLKREVGTLAM